MLESSFNEPISATQKMCEECEYVDELLSKAIKINSDPLQRLMYIASFVVSGFCHTKTRAIGNPFCGRAVAERIWKLEINSSARQKFWGQSLEIIPEDFNRLTILIPDNREDMDV
ncbi:hypothetical protein Pst134EA_030616 [Puccinia striiformis f. sp. tritici]|uniref:hypothetical protein n=1 Tax=Puccinia striiformis f. sp. tritici TaxID=168172 RepID=UPI002007558B|nr:hypothetical protein Pst134EA_030616 [Puccinia striiformis f. sp. tritici]KAH9446709.1 hypothetical protein Pst134EA_030616 [Puccinia striiformis f. sp. tritici]